MNKFILIDMGNKGKLCVCTESIVSICNVDENGMLNESGCIVETLSGSYESIETPEEIYKRINL